MTALSESLALMGPIQSTVQTGPVPGDALAADALHERHDENTRQWLKFIDRELNRWVQDPSWVEDDDLEPPTAEVLRSAALTARHFAAIGAPPPSRLVSDGEGGLVFERRAGNVFQRLSVLQGGSVELDTFVDGRLAGLSVRIL